MKKVLMLGGSRYLLPVIKACHELGHYAITCDYLPDNIAHSYSDEYHNISIIEKDKILSLAQDLDIDGIMSFACDPGVDVAAYVAEAMGLPHVGSYEAVSILQNKALFRQFLTKHGFNTPKAKSFSDISSAVAETDKFHWPVIVKPVDSAGSKGVSRVDERSTFESAIEYAIKFSMSRRFIVEEYIEQLGHSSDTDCFSVDGQLVFTSFSNQRFDKSAKNPHTPSAFNWPSSMPDEIQAELRSELQRLVSLLDLKTSLYNIETRQGTDGKAYIMEVSPRGGGNRLAEMLHYACGVDLITNAINAAVGDPINGITQDPVYKGFWGEIILHADVQGVFDDLWIEESLRPFIVERDLWVQPGDPVNSFTGANEAIGTLVLRFDSGEQMEDVLDNVSNFVRVRVKK